MSTVSYTLEITKDTATLRAAIEALISGPPSKEDKPAKATKVAKPEKSEGSDISFADFKKAGMKAKRDEGEDFANDVVNEFCDKPGATLGRTLSKIEQEDYSAIVDLWAAGLEEEEADDDDLDDDDLDDDDLDDDDLDDDDDDGEIDPEAVKTALKAYSKDVGREKAKALMAKNGASALSKVSACSQKQLAKMLKVCS